MADPQAGAPSQDKDVTLDEEAKRLKLEQVKAEARKAIADSQKATLAAQFPATDVKPLEGKIEVGEGVGLVAGLLAQGLLDKVAKEIVDQIKEKLEEGTSSVLLVEDRRLAASDWSYERVRGQLEVELEAVEGALGALAGAEVGEPTPEADALPLAAAGAALTAGTAIVGATAGLIGMLRSDYAISSKEVAIAPTPLLAALSKELLCQSREVTVDGFGVLNGKLIEDFRKATKKRAELERLSTAKKKAVIEPGDRAIEDRRAAMNDTEKAYNQALSGDTQPPGLDQLKERVAATERQVQKAEDAIRSVRALVATADALVTRFDTFATAITTAAGEGQYPPLVAAALRERLHADKDKHTHVLYAGIELSGGETVARRSLWSSGQVSFIGGVQVAYLLLDVNQNQIVSAGTRPALRSLKVRLSDGTAETLNEIRLT